MEEISRIVSAAWAEKPASFDVSVYREIERQPQTRQAVEGAVRLAYDVSDKDAPVVSSEERERQIQAEVERILAGQSKPQYFRERIRIDHQLYRVDRAVAGEFGQLTEDSPFTDTYVNAGSPETGDYTHFTYDHEVQTATLYNEKGMWKRVPANEWIGMPLHAGTLFKIILGKPEQTQGVYDFVPSTANMAAVSDGTHEKFALEILDVPGSENLVRLVSHGKAIPDNPAFAVVCDRDDYSRVKTTEYYNPHTGQLRESIEYGKLDDRGYPQEVEIIEYGEDGSITRREKIAVSEARLNVEIPHELFEFHAPEGYGIVDRRFTEPLVVSPHERTVSPGVAGMEIGEPKHRVGGEGSVARVAPNKADNRTAPRISGGAPEAVAGSAGQEGKGWGEYVFILLAAIVAVGAGSALYARQRMKRSRQ